MYSHVSHALFPWDDGQELTDWAPRAETRVSTQAIMRASITGLSWLSSERLLVVTGLAARARVGGGGGDRTAVNANVPNTTRDGAWVTRGFAPTRQL